MTERAHKEIELAIRAGNEPHALTKILSSVADAHINILAYCTYCDRNELVMLMVTDDPAGAKEAIRAAGFNCRANAVVIVSAKDQVGAVAQLGTRLGATGIDILYSYASSTGGDQFFAVFKTADDEAAIRVLTGQTSEIRAAPP